MRDKEKISDILIKTAAVLLVILICLLSGSAVFPSQHAKKHTAVEEPEVAERALPAENAP